MCVIFCNNVRCWLISFILLGGFLNSQCWMLAILELGLASLISSKLACFLRTHILSTFCWLDMTRILVHLSTTSTTLLLCTRLTRVHLVMDPISPYQWWTDTTTVACHWRKQLTWLTSVLSKLDLDWLLLHRTLWLRLWTRMELGSMLGVNQSKMLEFLQREIILMFYFLLSVKLQHC